MNEKELINGFKELHTKLRKVGEKYDSLGARITKLNLYKGVPKRMFDKFEAAFTARYKINALKSLLCNKDLQDENEGAQGDALLEKLVDKMVSYWEEDANKNVKARRREFLQKQYESLLQIHSSNLASGKMSLGDIFDLSEKATKRIYDDDPFIAAQDDPGVSHWPTNPIFSDASLVLDPIAIKER